MKIKQYLFFAFIMVLLVNACSSDDENGGTTTPTEEDRTEQQAKDKDTLAKYFQEHYYNSDALAGMTNPRISDIVITKLAEGESVPSGHTLLSDPGVLETKTIVYKETDYEYYILRLRQGGGDVQPNFSDLIRVNYEGHELDGEVFDSSVNPVNFDLVNLVKGWSFVIPEFNVAEDFVENGDGTVSFNNAGVGVMFIPSGLGYFSQATSGIEAYSQLVFKFELYQTKTRDHDADGIPSHLEDSNSNKDLSDDDLDENEIANYVDPDDDGDGVATFNELKSTTYTVDTNNGETEPVLAAKEYEVSRSEEDGVITIKTVTVMDSNGNGIDDYLEKEITTNYNEET